MFHQRIHVNQFQVLRMLLVSLTLNVLFSHAVDSNAFVKASDFVHAMFKEWVNLMAGGSQPIQSHRLMISARDI